MKFKLATLITFFCAFAKSQNVTTNFVTAAPNFREISGKLYNTYQSQLFQNLFIEPERASSNCVTAWKLRPVKRVYSGGSVNSVQSVGAYVGGGNAAGSYVVGFERDYQVAVTNWPDNADEIILHPISKSELVVRHQNRSESSSDLSKLSGNQICVRAIKIGNLNVSGKIIETWDVGTPHVVAVVTTNALPKP